MISLFAKPAVFGVMLIAAGPQLPQLDVQRLCMDTAGGDGVQKCVSDELYAKKKLLKYWSKTPLSFKQQCVLDPLPPDPSYLVLRDCIDNNVILQKEKEKGTDG